MLSSGSILEVIEDHVRVVDLLVQIDNAMSGSGIYPNYVPVLHDVRVSDILSRVIECLEGCDEA